MESNQKLFFVILASETFMNRRTTKNNNTIIILCIHPITVLGSILFSKSDCKKVKANSPYLEDESSKKKVPFTLFAKFDLEAKIVVVENNSR